MEKSPDTNVIEKFIPNPKFVDFGTNVPARASFVKVSESFTKSTQLSSGDKIARHMDVHWGNTEKQVGLIVDHEARSFEFTLPANIGDFFSISWAINDEILQQYGENKIISLGFESCELGKRPHEEVEMFGNLTFVKGKQTEKQTCAAGYYEKRLQASFNMHDQSEMWKNATRGWMDFVFADTKLRKIKLKQPMIWVQSKMSI